MAYVFKVSESQDFTIIDEKPNKKPETVGHVRVKPSGVLWADKSGQDWYRLSISDFATLAKKFGKKQTM
jgi:hypothetical protein